MASALFNADVCNAATVIIIMMVAVGWLVSVLEKKNPHLGSPSRGAYWGLMSFLNAADDKPGTRLGRLLTIVWLMSNLISLSIITCAPRDDAQPAARGGSLTQPPPARATARSSAQS